MRSPRLTARCAGFTLLEVMVAAASAMMMMAALISGSMTLQKDFQSTLDYAKQEGDLLRVWDYLSVDLRRALTVDLATDSGGNSLLTLTIPDYYQSNNPAENEYQMRRNPSLVNGFLTYGVTPLTVTYRQVGTVIRRTEGARWVDVVTGADSFRLILSDLRSKIVHTASFLPVSKSKPVVTSGIVQVRNGRRD